MSVRMMMQGRKPAAGGVSVSDDFNRANGSPGADWSIIAGSWGITSNRLGIGGGDTRIRHVTALSTDDQYVEANMYTSNKFPGICARMNSTGDTFYLLELNAATNVIIWKCVSGTFTNLAQTNGVAASGDLIRLEVSGSSLTGYVNGVSRVTATNSDIATGDYVGCRCFDTGEYDNFAGGDL